MAGAPPGVASPRSGRWAPRLVHDSLALMTGGSFALVSDGLQLASSGPPAAAVGKAMAPVLVLPCAIRLGGRAMGTGSPVRPGCALLRAGAGGVRGFRG